jgi:hypothetical protein
MSEQGGVRPDTSGVDFTAEMAAAKAAGEAAMSAQTATLAAAPGLGALVNVADDTNGNWLRETGAPDAPRYGEGQSHPAPDAPNQSGGRPHYAGPLAGDEDPYLGGA